MTDDNDTTDPLSGLRTPPAVSRSFARWYVVSLLAIVLTGAVGAWYVGILSPTASPDLTTPVEWLTKGGVVLFLFFTGAMVVRAVGLGFLKGLGRVAHNYELPEDSDEE